MSAARPSVLLVEDHAVMGRMMDRLLRERGNVDIWALVESAEEALEKLAAVDEQALRPADAAPPSHLSSAGARLPDLALVDVSLPGMSGIELVAEMRRLYPDLPCLMVSAHRDPFYVRQALDKGARGYVAKGDPAAIIKAVQLVLDGGRYLNNDVHL